MDRPLLGFLAFGAAATAVAVGAVVVTRRRQAARRSPEQFTGLGKSSVRERVQSNGMTLTHHRSAMPIKERLGLLQDLTYKSVQDPEMRKLALQITKDCPARDGQCEANAIDSWARKNIRYTGDVAAHKLGRNGPVEGVDMFQTAARTVEFGGGDCLPVSTLVLRDDFKLVPMLELQPGDRIMGDGGWTGVQEHWLTGEKEILEFALSNGCVLRCSGSHKLFRNVAGRVEEILASEARVGDDLVTPESIPFAAESLLSWPDVLAPLTAEERAWLLGVYVADGWSDGKTREDGSFAPYRSFISGQDGKPKEEQKRAVEALMVRAGVATRWHRKYIALNDSSLARMFAPIGGRAWEKEIPSIGFSSKEEVEAVVCGLNADAEQRDMVFGTTSPALALQMRVLRRMLGQSVHIRRVDNHGGFGSHPIYRVTPRAPGTERGGVQFARVRSISDGGVELCADITTDSGKFWLPESDVVVHNCDDHSVLNCTLAILNGLQCKFRVTSPTKRRAEDFTHIYAVAGLPKNRPSKWVAMDTTLPGKKLGVEAPFGKRLDVIA